MINFALCYEQEDTMNLVRDEVVRCFGQKGIIVAIKCYRSAQELQRHISCNCPDVLFYDMTADDGQMRRAVMEAKCANGKLVSVTTQGFGYIPPADDGLLEPMYVLPDKSRKHLWSYATLAYERLLDNEDSFSYYTRPNYAHIPISDIHYFASEGRRTHVVTSECHDTFYKKLDDVEELVRGKNCRFMRIHKSYLVNVRYISGYSRDFVSLTTGEKLRISNYSYYKRVNDHMKNLKSKRHQYTCY